MESREMGPRRIGKFLNGLEISFPEKTSDELAYANVIRILS